MLLFKIVAKIAASPTALPTKLSKMRLLTLILLLIPFASLSAQYCAEGEGLLTAKTVNSATCLYYRTVLTLANDQPYIVAFSASRDSVTLARSIGRRFIGKKTWARTPENVTKSVFIHNGYIQNVKNKQNDH